MASISKLPRGRRKIQFTDTVGKRQTVFLGKVSQRHAEGWKLRIEQLVIAKRLQQQPEDDVAKWLAKLSDKMHAKLSRTGLIPPRSDTADQSTKLGPWIDRYISGRTDAKPSTVTVWRRTQKHLLAYFGAGRALSSITTADAIEFRLNLLSKRPPLSDNTTRRTTGIAKQFMERAVKAKLIEDNPFRDADLPTSTTGNKARERFVTRSEADKVLKACPDAEWRLIFALSRYGGLRCPSEHLRLQWSDVDWERSRLTITAPKTEHHDGKGVRVIPVFPELRPHLEEVYEAAPDGETWIITRYRRSNANLRTLLEKIIRRAGLEPWPKLFHNLRASRQTELAATFPIHVVCAWLGNSPRIAMQHYLQVTDADYEMGASEIERNHEHPVQFSTVPERPRVTRKTRKGPEITIKPVKTRPSRWAMRDSNPRHPPCKGGALAD